jgi:hypothetical protein
MDKVDLEGYQFFASPSDRALLSEVLDRLAAVEEENRQIKTALEERDDEIAALREEIALERAYDRQRLARLETPAPPLREETASAHLDRLFSEMRRLKMRYTTIKDAARLLDISKPHMHKLKPYLAEDSRFAIIKDPHHGQRQLIGIV